MRHSVKSGRKKGGWAYRPKKPKPKVTKAGARASAN